MANGFQALSKKIPEANQAVAEQAKAAREILLRKQVADTQPTRQNVSRIAQAAAPQAVTQMAQPTLEAATKTQQQLGAIGGEDIRRQEFDAGVEAQRQELGMQEYLSTRELAGERNLAGERTALRKRLTTQEINSAKLVSSIGIEMDNKLLSLDLAQREQLAALGNDVKGKILDSRIMFDRDEMGRRFTNERQLSDFAILSAQNEQDFQSKMLKIQQGYKKKAILYEILVNRMQEVLRRGWLTKEQGLDQALKEDITRTVAAMKREIERNATNARRNAMYTQGVVTVAAAVITGGLA